MPTRNWRFLKAWLNQTSSAAPVPSLTLTFNSDRPRWGRISWTDATVPQRTRDFPVPHGAWPMGQIWLRSS